MKTLTVLWALLSATISQACDPANVSNASDIAKKERQLSFRREGDDLVVAATITINGSPHVLLTSYRRDGNNITLRYTVIQSSDQLVRCLKLLTVEWHLRGVQNDDVDFKVVGKELSFNDAELKQLSEKIVIMTATR